MVAGREQTTRAKRASNAGHYLAVTNAGFVFALPVAAILRILDWSQPGRPHAEHGISVVDDEQIVLVDVDAWTSRPGAPPSARHLVLIRTSEGVAGLLVDEALTVFHCQPHEMLPGPGSDSEDQGLITGFCPWVKLSGYLVRGAIPANNLALALIRSLGGVRREDDTLWAGNRRLNGDKTVVDHVLGATGYGCTIFDTDVRIATTATTAGSNVRAVGTRANDEVTAITLRGGREYRGVTRTIGKDWAIVYRPLRDARREIVGMVATYREVSTRVFPLVKPQRAIELFSPFS